MAENIYTSEFMDENGLPLVPPDLAKDFETEGTAAQNLIDSAAAQRTVEAAVSRAVGSLMLPSEEPEISIVSPKRIVDSVGDHSPPWDTSLKHVFDATALYEASVTEKAPVADTSQARSAKGAAKEDDTQLEGEEDYDYEDDYTDISDEDEEDEEYNSESPSPWGCCSHVVMSVSHWLCLVLQSQVIYGCMNSDLQMCRVIWKCV